MKRSLLFLFFMLLPLSSYAAVTPERTIPVYSRYCNYGYCHSAKVYHYTPTPYVPVVSYSNVYRVPRIQPVRVVNSYNQPVYHLYNYYTPRLANYYW